MAAVLTAAALMLFFVPPWAALFGGVFSSFGEGGRKVWEELYGRRDTVFMLLARTIAYSAAAATVGFLAGAPAGILAARWRLRSRRPAVIFYVMGLLLPPAWMTGAWLQWLSAVRFGSGGPRLFELRVNAGCWPAAAVLCGLWLAPPIALLAFVVVSRSGAGGGNHERAALNLSSPWRALWEITVSLNRSALAGVWLIAFILAGGSLAAADLLGIRTLTEEVFFCLARPGLKPAAYLVSVLLAVPLIPAAAAAFILLHPERLSRSARTPVEPLVFHGSKMENFTAGAIVFMALLLMAALPLSAMFFSFSSGGFHPVALVWKEFLSAADSVKATFFYSAAAAAAAVLISIPVTVFLRHTALGAGNMAGINRSRDPLVFTVVVICIATLALPSTVWSAAFLSLDKVLAKSAGHEGALREFYLFFRDDAAGLLVWALAARFAPLAVLAGWAALLGVPDTRYAAAMNLGASRFRIFRTVDMPVLAPAIFAVWLVILGLASGDLGCVYMLHPAGISPASVSILNRLHYGDAGAVAGFGGWYLPAGAILGIILARVLFGSAPVKPPPSGG